MRKRFWNSGHTSGRRPLPHARRMRCRVSFWLGGLLTRYRHSSPMYWNSVHSKRTMSSQNSRPENRSRIAAEPPCTSTEPIAHTPPVVWYIGRHT